MAAAINQDSAGLGGIASLISTAAPLLFGAGKKTTTSTTGGGTSVQSPTVDPAMLAILQNIVGQATANSTDPSKTADIVSSILRKAQVAFAPTTALASRSGLYNSSTVQKLADESIANATESASKAVLDYQTQQQEIARRGATDIINTTKSETTTASPQSRTDVTNQASGIPSNVSSLLGIGLLGAQVYSQRKKLLDLVGLGGGDSPAAWDNIKVVGEDLPIPLPPDFVSESAAASLSSGIPSFENVFGVPVPTSVPSVGNAFQSAGDADIVGLFSGGAEGATATDGISGLLDNLPSSVGDAVSGVGDFLGGVGGGLADAGTSFIKTIADLFDFF